MFGPMRRKDRELGREASEAILAEGTWGTLSQWGEDGYPYSVPLSYAWVDGVLYFHGAREGYKWRAAAADGRASFCVVIDVRPLPAEFTTNYRSAIVVGDLSEVWGDEKRQALEALIAKYSPGFPESGLDYVRKAGEATRVFKLAVRQITGKQRPGPGA